MCVIDVAGLAFTVIGRRGVGGSAGKAVPDVSRPTSMELTLTPAAPPPPLAKVGGEIVKAHTSWYIPEISTKRRIVIGEWVSGVL